MPIIMDVTQIRKTVTHGVPPGLNFRTTSMYYCTYMTFPEVLTFYS